MSLACGAGRYHNIMELADPECPIRLPKLVALRAGRIVAFTTGVFPEGLAGSLHIAA